MFGNIETEKCKFHHRKNLILLEDVDINNMNFCKNIMIFVIKSVIVLKNNLIAKPSIKNLFLKTEIRSYGDETTYFHTKKLPEAGFYHICWLVLMIIQINLINSKSKLSIMMR